MKRRRYILIGLGVVVFVAIGGFVLQQRIQGPRYQGKTVEGWLATVKHGDDVRTNVAIRTMLTKLGPSAIPPLIRAVDRDYSLLDKLSRQTLNANSVPSGVKSIVAKRLSERWWPSVTAAYAIPLTATNALAAIPQLEKIVLDLNRPGGDWLAMHALARIGGPAIPTLTRLLTNAPTARQQALRGVLEMEWRMQLRTGDFELREQAAIALSELFPSCYENIPILGGMSESRDWAKREVALRALSKLAPESVAARDALRRATKSDDPNTRRLANEILETLPGRKYFIESR